MTSNIQRFTFPAPGSLLRVKNGFSAVVKMPEPKKYILREASNFIHGEVVCITYAQYSPMATYAEIQFIVPADGAGTVYQKIFYDWEGEKMINWMFEVLYSPPYQKDAIAAW